MDANRREIRHYIHNGRDVIAGWLQNLRDNAGRGKILDRIDRLADGNLGDHRWVGGGVCELRVHFGPGYRVYFGEDGTRLVVLICGGSKDSQAADIDLAQRFWAEFRRSK